MVVTHWLLVCVFFQAEDGIRDVAVTGVQTCALPIFKQATTAMEDKNFYQHRGFAFEGILRAATKIVFKHQLQGGSTITQQLVKTTLLTPERTVRRKIREAFLSMLTEFLYSKDQILELYLNHVPYGGTAYCIEQAAKKHFGTPT